MALFDNFKKKLKVKPEDRPFEISSPVAGIVMNITETQDPAFSSEAMGKGVGIVPSKNNVVAPIGGEIMTLFPTCHAIGIMTEKGVEILIHVGIDTVKLKGKYFTAKKKQGDKINRGDVILEVDFDGIAKEGYDTTVMTLITNTTNFRDINILTGEKDIQDTVIRIDA